MDEPGREGITVDRDGHLVLIGVNRPAKRNAFGLSMLEALSAAYDRLGAERELGRILYAHGDHSQPAST